MLKSLSMVNYAGIVLLRSPASSGFATFSKGEGKWKPI
jgi:hypothetical protein